MWKLVKSHSKNNFIGMAVVTIFITLAVMLASIGVSISLKINDIYNDKVAQTMPYDSMIETQFRDDFSLTMINRIFEKNKNVSYFERDKILVFADNTQQLIVNGEADNYGRFTNMDNYKERPLKILDEIPVEGHSFYLAEMYKIKGTFKLGQVFDFQLGEKIFKMTLAGWVDSPLEVYYGRSYIHNQTYLDLEEFFGENKTYVTSYRICLSDTSEKAQNIFIKDVIEQVEVLRQINKLLNRNQYDSYLSFGDMGGAKQSIESFVTILSVIMLVFALIVVLITLIIIAFLINSAIEHNIEGIGILKANGYTTLQVRVSYLIQYMTLFIIGTILGGILALATMQQFLGIVSIATNLSIHIPFNVVGCVLSIFVTFFALLGIIFYTTARIRKIYPIMALRKGISTHSFKKNRIALEKVRTNPNVALSLKSIFNNARQSVMIFVVIAVMAMVTTFSSVLFYNMNVDYTAMTSIIGVENSDYLVFFDLREESIEKRNELFTTLENSEYVEKFNYQLSSGEYCSFGDIAGATYSYINNEMCENYLVEGRLPTANNEIAVSARILRDTGKSIGDYVEIKILGQKVEVLITGIVQNINIPYFVYMTANGMSVLAPDVYDLNLRSSILIKLKDGVDRNEFYAFIEKLAEGLPAYEISDTQIHIEKNLLGTLAPSASALMAIMSAITVLIVFLVMLMVINLKITREKKSIAINKALGYTSNNIIFQIGFSMFLLSALATIVGVLLGSLLTSPILLFFLKMYGIMKITLLVNWWYSLAIILFIPTIAVLCSSVVAKSTKYITPIKLLRG